MKKMNKNYGVLEQDILQTLLLATAPLEAPAGQAAAIKSRLFARIRGEPTIGEAPLVTVRATEGEWTELMPRVRVKFLHRDDRHQSVLVRLEPGAVYPAHAHSEDEECVVLDGEVRIGDIRITAGDYHLARGGSRHSELRSEAGALLFIRIGTADAPAQAAVR